MSDTENLDGYATSFVDKDFTVTPYGGEALTGLDIKSISITGTIERGTQMSGGKVKKTTRGSVTYDGSITFYGSGLLKTKRGLAGAPNAPRDENGRIQLGLVRFDIDVQDKDHVPAADRRHRRILSCALMGEEGELTEGNDPDEVTIPIEIRNVVEIIDGNETVLL